MNSLKLYIASKIIHLLPETRGFKLKNRLYRWTGVKIGNNVRICSSAMILGAGELEIGDNTWLGHRAFISASSSIKIGNNVDIAPNVFIGNGTHEITPDRDRIADIEISKDIVIGDGCWLCANSCILAGVTIGNKCVVAAGAVVTKSFGELKLIAGVPAIEKKTFSVPESTNRISKPIYICITPFFPSPDSWRGAYIWDQVEAIERNSDFEVVVFKPASFSDKTKEYEVNRRKVYLFPTLQSPSYLFNGLFNGYNDKSFIKRVKEAGIDINRIKYVHTHTGPFATYGVALRKIAPHAKIFVQHHDLDPFTIRNGKLARWESNAKYRAKNSLQLINAVDLNICISTPCKDNLFAFPEARPAEVYQSYIDALKPIAGMPKAQPKDVYVLYNGVDTSLFKANDDHDDDDNLFRIGCIANFQELKDHITLVRAFKILVDKGYTNMRLSLLGTGETKSEIIAFLKENNLYDLVEWPSEVTHDKLPEYYRTLDLFVLPSVFEGFGCVYTEAYACGVPFIGVYDQGAAEIIAPEERDKWLIKPHHHEQLVKLIERYYNERDEQHLCQPIDIDILVRNFIKYIEKP